MMMSQPPSRWKGESPPSPVSIQQPASAAPRDSARTAGSEIAPKLMPLMLTTDFARKGSSQKSSPIASGGVGRRGSPTPGQGWVTKRIEPAPLAVLVDAQRIRNYAHHAGPALLSCRSQSASDDRRSGAASQNLRQDAEDHRLRIVGRAALDLGLGGRAHVDHGAGKLERHAGERMVGVEHYFVFGDVGDGEDQIFLVAARCALEAHSDLEGLGKAAARLDSEKVFVVVAESVLGLQAHFDAILGSLALEGGLGRRKYVPVAAVQILQGLLGALDELAPDVGQLDVERDDRVFRDVQVLGSGLGTRLTQR